MNVVRLRVLHRRLVLLQRALAEIRRGLDLVRPEQARAYIAALERHFPPEVAGLPPDGVGLVGERVCAPESFAVVCGVLERLGEHVDRERGVGSGARLRQMQGDLRAVAERGSTTPSEEGHP